MANIKYLPKKEWFEGPSPKKNDRPDPIEYIASLDWSDQNDLCTRLEQSRHWKGLCRRVHNWINANGYDGDIEQAEEYTLRILLKFMGTFRCGQDQYGVNNYYDGWRTMKEAGFTPYKPTKRTGHIK